MMVHLRFVDVEQDLAAAFSMHDARGMGQITPQRLRSVVAQVGDNWTEDDVTSPPNFTLYAKGQRVQRNKRNKGIIKRRKAE